MDDVYSIFQLRKLSNIFLPTFIYHQKPPKDLGTKKLPIVERKFFFQGHPFSGSPCSFLGAFFGDFFAFQTKLGSWQDLLHQAWSAIGDYYADRCKLPGYEFSRWFTVTWSSSPTSCGQHVGMGDFFKCPSPNAIIAVQFLF